MKVAVTGPNGLIGSRIIELLQNNFEILPLSHNDIDITDPKKVEQKLSTLDYDILLHLAGYTNVEGAETEKDLAYNLNVNGTKNIFDAVQKQHKKMIYISTDFVFDGKNPPYEETSVPHPLGYYALTKYEGEKVLKNNAMIVRISFPYGISHAQKPDFVKRIKNLLEEGKELHMITDGAITPTYIDDIALSLKYLINNFTSEMFHIVGTQAVSPFESGRMIASKFGFSTDLIKPISFEEYTKNKAPRPQYSTIVSKENSFQKMRSFEEGLKLL